MFLFYVQNKDFLRSQIKFLLFLEDEKGLDVVEMTDERRQVELPGVRDHVSLN